MSLPVPAELPGVLSRGGRLVSRCRGWRWGRLAVVVFPVGVLSCAVRDWWSDVPLLLAIDAWRLRAIGRRLRDW